MAKKELKIYAMYKREAAFAAASRCHWGKRLLDDEVDGLVALLVRARKPLTPDHIRVVKRRLDAIEQDRYPNAYEHVRGEARAVPRYLFIFEGLDSYHPGQTELALAEVGDEYYVVTLAAKPAHPIRLYRADTYTWDEASND